MNMSTEPSGKARHNTSLARLKAVDLARTKAGYHHDGGGLYLQVREGSGGLTRSWVFRYTRQAKARIMGLGPLDILGLADAREKARDARRLLLDGIDPLEAREAHRTAQRVAVATAMTFRQSADAYIAAHEASWSNPKHAAQWAATLDKYAYPVFGDLPVASIDTGLVMKAIEPIWNGIPETASRVRGRIESILGWATSREYRQGDNPARWKGHLENLLPAPAKAKRAARQARNKGEHFDALPYAEISGFISALREQVGTAARALEFAILTAARTGEVIGARWREINLVERVWIVPGERMKAGKEHRVPLSDRALAIIGEAKAPDDFVFQGGKPGQPLSNMAMLKLLQRMGLRTANGGLTVHGFRSSFMDWATERTHFPAEMRDLALAHVVADKVEAAYRRGDMFDQRRELMAAWAQFCERADASEKVVPMRVRG
jgi:integrase